jgi:ABC-type transporter Mla subunit MlaD
LLLFLSSTTMTSTSAAATPGSNINSLFCSITPATARQILDEIADDLAKDIHVRQQMGQASPSVWPGLNKLWRSIDARNPASRDLIASLAKFTRNLVAAVPDNQTKALYVFHPVEPQFSANLV